MYLITLLRIIKITRDNSITVPQRLFNFEALRFTHKKVRCLFQSKKNYSQKGFKKLAIFSFQVKINNARNTAYF